MSLSAYQLKRIRVTIACVDLVRMSFRVLNVLRKVWSQANIRLAPQSAR